MIARNPYVIGVPLTDAAAFYGRQDVFHFVKDVLEAEKQNVIVLYGQRRIGKTSVLHRATDWLREQGGFLPVYFDLQGKAGLSLDEVLATLAQTIARRLTIDKPDASLFDDDGRYFSDRFLPAAFSRLDGRRLVLLFDEFDVLGDELASPRAASETLFPYLQDLIANQRQVGFVFVVGRRIEELATHFQAIFKQAAYRRIGRLAADESRALVVEPARGSISYDDDAVLEIQQLAAGHPYFTQLICFEAFNAVKANGRDNVTAQVIHDAVNRAIESGHGALNWFWEGLPRAERFILSAVAHVSSESGVSSNDDVRRLLEEHRILLSGLELKDAPDRLVEWEMLRRNGPDAYGFVVELVRRWVIQEHPLASARRDIDYVSKRAVRLFENAREAHSANELPYARDEYRRTLKANPNHSGAQLGLAQVLYELGELDEAIVEFERAYGIDEMSARDGLVRARLARADGLEKQALADQAFLEYEHVLRLAPAEETAQRRVASIWLARADAALTRGEVPVARDAFREALRYDRDNETAARARTALIAHGEEAATLGRVDQASATYSLLLELQPDHEEAKTRAAAFWTRCADLFDGQGQLDSAIESLTKLTALLPDDAAAAARLAGLQRKLEERQAVGRIFQHAFAAHRAGNMDLARDGWKKLIQLDVLSYEGLNIATMLAETVLAPTPEPKQSIQGAPGQLVDVLAPAGVADAQAKAPVDIRARPKRRKGAAHPNEPAPLEKPEEQAQEEEEQPHAPLPEWAYPREKARRREQEHEPAQTAPSVEADVPADDSLPAPAYEPFPATNVRRIVTVIAALAATAIIFFSWPASIIGIYLEPHREVKSGDYFGLYPYLKYSSEWRRRTDGYVSSFSYSWSSTNSGVATVDSFGGVRAIGPGRTEIVAQYRGFSASTDVVVVPSVTAVIFASQQRLKVGETVKLTPTLVEDGGRQRGADGSQSDFAWTSQNQAVATVNAATVTGVAPGAARITVRYQGVEGATSVTVLPWDVPPMKANFVGIKFYEGAGSVEVKDRKYKSEFDAKTPGIWSELELTFDLKAKERGLQANFSATLFRSDNSQVDKVPFTIQVPRDWGGVVMPISFGRPPADTYRVEFTHAGAVIGAAKFVVK